MAMAELGNRGGEGLPLLSLVDHLELRPWPDPCFFYDRAAVLQVFVANVYREILDGLSPGDAVLDCGANIGCFTIAASYRVGPRGSVIAVEPEPANLATLRANIRALGLDNVTVVPKALSGEAGRTVRISGSGMFAHVSEQGSNVETTSLAEIARGLGDRRIAGLKMDIEGSELPALQAPDAGAVLRRTERFGVEVQGISEERAMRDLLARAGFARTWATKEYAFLPRAALRVLRHPSLPFRLYGDHVGDFVDRLMRGFTGTVRPDPASEQGFVSQLILAQRS